MWLLTEEVREMWLIQRTKPWKPAKKMMVRIRHCKKQVWCDTDFNNFGVRSFLYGTSSFGTIEAADRERFSLMAEFASDWWNIRFKMSAS